MSRGACMKAVIFAAGVWRKAQQYMCRFAHCNAHANCKWEVAKVRPPGIEPGTI